MKHAYIEMQKPSAVQQAYWDVKLKQYGLTPEVGHPKWLSYGHKVADLDFDGVKTYTTASDIEENQEWPVSL